MLFKCAVYKTRGQYENKKRYKCVEMTINIEKSISKKRRKDAKSPRQIKRKRRKMQKEKGASKERREL